MTLAHNLSGPCKWPGSFTVQQIVTGFESMDELIRQDHTGKMKVTDAFVKVFQVPWKRQTYYDNLKLWKNAPLHLRERFMQHTSTKEGAWGVFVSKLRKRHAQDADAWESDASEPQSDCSNSESLMKDPAATATRSHATDSRTASDTPTTHDDLEYIVPPSRSSSPLPELSQEELDELEGDPDADKAVDSAKTPLAAVIMSSRADSIAESTAEVTIKEEEEDAVIPVISTCNVHDGFRIGVTSDGHAYYELLSDDED